MSAGGEPLGNGTLELYHLNAGQADATVTITEEGEILLIDADKDKIIDELETVLADRMIERTENGNTPLVFATTHLHQDHIKGLEKLGQNDYEISHAIQPDNSRFEIIDADTHESEEGISKDNIQDYREDLINLGVERITQVSRGDRVPIDSDANLSVLAPPDTDESVDVTRASTGADVNLPPERLNENSAVYKLEGEQSVLFMGDVQDKSDHYGESWLIQEHDNSENDVDLDADVLVVSHHGSNKATSNEFLERVDPEVAQISSGLDNKYTSENEHDAHPHDATLKRLHDRDVDVYWTAGHGTLRTELDSENAFPEPTTNLATTNAADVAALKYYCRENEIDPDTVGVLPPDLPEKTPEWAIDAALMVTKPNEQFIDKAVATAETVEDLRQTLVPAPNAHDQLRETIQADRDEHITTREDVERNKETYFNAVDRERAYERLPLHTRIRANLPERFGGIKHPLNDVPDPDEIDGPRKMDTVPKAVSKPPAAKQRESGELPHDFGRTEQAADEAVDTAETTEQLCHSLRETPGTHKDVLYALETPNAHTKNKPEKDLDDLLERTNEHERTEEQTQTHDQDVSLGL